jgi:hypothetical protein
LYGAFAVIGWLLLVLSFLVMHQPEKTTSELIREFR